MTHSLRKRIKRSIYRRLLRGVYRDLLEEECVRRIIASTSEVYGAFEDGDAYRDLAVYGIGSESGTILGEVVHALKRVCRPEHELLLAGERRSAVSDYSGITGIPRQNITTAGVHDDMDYRWDYERAPPDIPAVDCIVSHAMLEHLIDPCRHVLDCFGLLRPQGFLVLHSVMPGFQYHRFPVDCLRFFPDWFEELAIRLNARIASRYLSGQGHIVYVLSKSGQIECGPAGYPP